MSLQYLYSVHCKDELETAATQATELQRLMVGRELHHEYYRESLQSGPSERCVLSVAGLSLAGVFEDVSFDGPDLKKKNVKVDVGYVRKQLADIVKDQDLSRYIL